MKIFLSYPSAHRPLAEKLALALEAEGHEVFFDRTDLPPGGAFHQPLRDAIGVADALVFLVAPESVALGSYALAELNLAQARWRRPAGRVLPVMVAPTPMSALPPYLQAVTVLEPRGEIVAETVAAVARLRTSSRRRVGLAAGVGALVVAAAGGLWVREQHGAGQRAADAAAAASQHRELGLAQTAMQLCNDGSHAVAMSQLAELAARAEPQPQVLALREDCAMQWLREMRATGGQTTFVGQVAQVQPVLLQGPARSQGARAADLRAHIGWGEFLRSREGAADDPVPHWQRALKDDPDNPYANAMWALKIAWQRERLPEALPMLAKAVASGRDRPFVRRLQLGATLDPDLRLLPYALGVANEMRRAGEPLRADLRERFWSAAFGWQLLTPAQRKGVLAALSAADLLATFEWLHPLAEQRADRQPLWHYNHATLLANAGQRDAARAELEQLAATFQASGGHQRLVEATQRALRE